MFTKFIASRLIIIFSFNLLIHQDKYNFYPQNYHLYETNVVTNASNNTTLMLDKKFMLNILKGVETFNLVVKETMFYQYIIVKPFVLS